MKKLLALALIISIGTTIFSAGVNEEELKSVKDDGTIVFQNYSGPHAVIESAASIKSIGTALGNELKNNITSEGRTFGNPKYEIIHAVDPSVKEKLDADIFILHPSAGIDHIKNLRRVIAAYLEETYEYSEKDSLTIAAFITVYNAVYRGKPEYFSSKYKDKVLSYLDNDKCGISLNWQDWPGKTQIVIPLSDYMNGGLSSVDTSIISDKNVINSMKEDDEKGIDERKNLVNIKEREAEEATDKAIEAAKKAADERKALEEQKEVQKKAEKAAADAEKKAEANPDDEELNQKAEEARQKAEEEKIKTEEQKSEAEQAQQEAEEAQRTADKKLTESQSERGEIAKDQKKLIDEQMKAEIDGTVIGLSVDSKTGLSSLVKLNCVTGEIFRESPVKVIRGRTVIPVQDAVVDVSTGASFPATNGDTTFYMAVCGDSSTVRLCLIDCYKMEIQMESSELISEDSVLVNSGNHYYAVINDNGKYWLGCYDKSIALQRKSPVEVIANTAVTVTNKGIIVSDKSGKPTLLSLADLSVIE